MVGLRHCAPFAVCTPWQGRRSGAQTGHTASSRARVHLRRAAPPAHGPLAHLGAGPGPGRWDSQATRPAGGACSMNACPGRSPLFLSPLCPSLWEASGLLSVTPGRQGARRGRRPRSPSCEVGDPAVNPRLPQHEAAIRGEARLPPSFWPGLVPWSLILQRGRATPLFNKTVRTTDVCGERGFPLSPPRFSELRSPARKARE